VFEEIKDEEIVEDDKIFSSGNLKNTDHFAKMFKARSKKEEPPAQPLVLSIDDDDG